MVVANNTKLSNSIEDCTEDAKVYWKEKVIKCYVTSEGFILEEYATRPFFLVWMLCSMLYDVFRVSFHVICVVFRGYCRKVNES